MYRFERTGFMLQKWSFDCVAETGEVFIGYMAQLHWSIFRFGYLGFHLFGNSGAIDKCRAGELPDPGNDDNQLYFHSDALRVNGLWKNEGSRFSRVVYSTRSGIVRWECLQPKAAVELRVDDKLYRGTGYIDKVTTTIKPWELPVVELSTGRFHSPGRSAVWVDWRGPFAQAFMLDNGKIHSITSHTETGLQFADRELQLNPSRQLLTFPMSDVVSQFDLLRWAIPKHFQKTTTAKHVGTGRYTGDGDPAGDGIFISEHVRFT